MVAVDWERFDSVLVEDGVGQGGGLLLLEIQACFIPGEVPINILVVIRYRNNSLSLFLFRGLS